MDKVYIETTIPSYVTARISKDLVVAGHQQLTVEWWEIERHNYDLYISEVVLAECGMGDSEAAKRRLDLLSGIAILNLAEEVKSLAIKYVKALGIPEKNELDAFHIAFVVISEIDYLMTWNCSHMAHGEVRAKLRDYNRDNNLFEPVLLTPYELMGRNYYGK